MLQYFFSTEFRKVYTRLADLGVLGDSFTSFSCSRIEQFLKNSETDLNQFIKLCIKIMSEETLSPSKCFKFVAFLHIFLQNIKVLQNPDDFLQIINHILTKVDQLIKKNKKKSEKILKQNHSVSRSAVFNESLKGGEWREENEFNKQKYLLVDVLKPYILFLQKVVSIFDFYNMLKSHYLKILNEGESWIILNILKLITLITNQIPCINRFMKKSFGKVADTLASSFCEEIVKLYPKIYKFVYSQLNNIHKEYYTLENTYGEKAAFLRHTLAGIDSMVNLIQDLKQINLEIRVIFKSESLSQLQQKIEEPKYIDIEGEDFAFILHFWEVKNGLASYKNQEISSQNHSAETESIPNEIQSENERFETLKSEEKFKDITNAIQGHMFETFRKDHLKFQKSPNQMQSLTVIKTPKFGNEGPQKNEF